LVINVLFSLFLPYLFIMSYVFLFIEQLTLNGIGLFFHIYIYYLNILHVWIYLYILRYTYIKYVTGLNGETFSETHTY
jgi:hypothetical protein